MGDTQRDEIAARLRADNVAPTPDDAFFVTLSELAASSRRAEPHARAGRSAARLTIAGAGAGVLLTVGALASAFVLVGDTTHERVRNPIQFSPAGGPSADPSTAPASDDEPGEGSATTHGSDDADSEGAGRGPANGPSAPGSTLVPPGQSPSHALPDQANEHADAQMPPAEQHRRDGDHRRHGDSKPPQAVERPQAVNPSKASSGLPPVGSGNGPTTRAAVAPDRHGVVHAPRP